MCTWLPDRSGCRDWRSRMRTGQRPAPPIWGGSVVSAALPRSRHDGPDQDPGRMVRRRFRQPPLLGRQRVDRPHGPGQPARSRPVRRAGSARRPRRMPRRRPLGTADAPQHTWSFDELTSTQPVQPYSAAAYGTGSPAARRAVHRAVEPEAARARHHRARRRRDRIRVRVHPGCAHRGVGAAADRVRAVDRGPVPEGREVAGDHGPRRLDRRRHRGDGRVLPLRVDGDHGRDDRSVRPVRRGDRRGIRGR